MSSRTSLQRLYQSVWPWAKSVEPKGPIVAVIELSGVLHRRDQSRGGLQAGNIHFEKAKKDVDRAFGLAKVQAVALDINCPGGAPVQCELISSYIRSKAAKHNVPVLAFANDVAASGGYWLMCAADELYACKTSLVGSIGVVGNSFGFVDVLKRVGVERRIAVAGDKKISIDPFSEQTKEQIVVQQELMGSLHETFISFVKERRGSALINPEKQDIFSGRVWTGTDAVKVGLVDNVGTLSEVLKTRHGDDVSIQRFGKPKVPWWVQFNTHSSDSVSPGVGVSALCVSAAVEEFFDAVNTRMLWERHQL